MILLLVAFLLLWYIFNRSTCGVTKSPTCLIGKTVIVTGGSGGLGYETCLNLASRGCRVIVADINEPNETQKKLISATKNPNIVSKKLDLSSFKSIRNFATDIISSEEKIDILIHNAGIGGSSVDLTEDGLNAIMQINYFGPFLLTHLLLNLLKKSESGRIIFVSSMLAFCGSLTVDTFTSTGKSSGILAAIKFYSKSKLAMIIASDMFAIKLKKYGITSNSLHPGIIGTQIYNTVDKISIINFLLYLFLYVYGKTSWEGSQTIVHLAVSQDVDKVTGKYFWDCRKFIKPSTTRDTHLCKKIWEISEDVVKLTSEEKI